MRRIVKRIILGLTALVALALVVLVGFVVSFDPNAWREDVESAVRDATGRDLTLGPMEFELSSRLRLQLQDVALSNHPSGSAEKMLEVKVLEVQVPLSAVFSALFSQPVPIERLRIEGVRVLVERLPDGMMNTDFAPADSSKTDASGTESSTANGGMIGLPIVPLGVEIGDVTVRYQDAQAGHKRALRVETLTLADQQGLTLNLDGQLDDLAIAMSGKMGSVAALADSDQLWPVQIDGNIAGIGIKVEGTMEDPVRLSGLDIKFAVTGDEIARAVALLGNTVPALGPYTLSAHLKGDLNRRFSVADLQVRMGDQNRLLVRLDGQGDIELAQLFESEMALKAVISAPKVEVLNPYFEAFGAPEIPAVGPLSIQGDVALNAQGWRLDDIALGLGTPKTIFVKAGGALTGTLSPEDAIPLPADGQLEISVRAANAGRLASLVQPYVSSPLPPLEGRVNSTVKLEVTDGVMRFPELALRIGPGGPLEVQVQGRVASLTASGEPSGVDVKVQLETTKLKALTPLIEPHAPRIALPSGRVWVEMHVVQDADKRLNLKDLVMEVRTDAAQLAVQGVVQDLSAHPASKGPAFKGTVTLKSEDMSKLPGLLKATLGQTLPQMAGTFTAHADVSGGLESFTVPSLSVRFAHGQAAMVKIDGAIKAINPQTESQVEGVTLAVEASMTHKAGRAFGADLPQIKPVTLKADLSMPSLQAAELKLSALTVGKSTVHGTVSVKNIPTRPDVTVAIRGDGVELRDYMVPKGHGNSEQSASPPEAGGDDTARVIPATPLPLEALRSMDAELSLALAAVTLGGQPLGASVLRMRLQGGDVETQEARFGLGAGAILAEFALQQKNDEASLLVDIQSQDLDIAVLWPLMGMSKALVQGPAMLKVDLATQGEDIRGLAASLDGNLTWKMDSGNIDFAAVGDEFGLGALLPGGGQEALSCMTAVMDFDQGLGTLSRLAVHSQPLTLIGGGRLDLRTEQLDMNMVPRARLAGLKTAVPVDIKGTLAAPDVQAHSLSAAANLLGNVLGTVTGLDNPEVKDLSNLGPCYAKISESEKESDVPSIKGTLEGIQDGIGDTLKKGLGGLF